MAEEHEVLAFTRTRIEYLKRIPDPGKQKALLAQLRRGAGHAPGDLPQLWGVLFQDMPEAMMSRSGAPSHQEWAIYTALTLYAFHQQGRDPGTDCMYRTGQGIGRAAAALVEREEDFTSVQRRFNRFATASDMPEVVTHLRSIVALLKAKGIALDYPALALDLYRYQFYDGAQSVRLKWGQDFYRNINKKNEGELENE